MDVYGFEFKKMYGQNFIKETNIVEKIADTAQIMNNSLVIEIGPGSGMLTKQLAVRSNQVLAYEIDNRLEEILNHELVDCPNVYIIYDDFLKRNIKQDIVNYSYDHLYVVANLPYYITTPIITKLIEEEICVDKIVVMVQKEVGDRFSAKTGTKDYNSLSVFLQYYFDVKKEFLVSRNSFVPKPNVDSIVISMTRKKELLDVRNLSFFFQLVRDSFKFKRKNLRNNLKNYDLEIFQEALSNIEMDLTIRAEQLTLENFILLSNYYIEHNGKNKA